MAIELKLDFLHGKDSDVISYFGRSESGAIKVNNSNSNGHTYHFKDSTVVILPITDDASLTIYSDEKIKAAYAKNQIEIGSNVKLEEIK